MINKMESHPESVQAPILKMLKSLSNALRAIELRE